MLRRTWLATIVIGLLAGLAAAAAMTAWQYQRRTATSLDRYLTFTQPAQAWVFYCAPGGDISTTPLDCFPRNADNGPLSVARSSEHVVAAAQHRQVLGRLTFADGQEIPVGLMVVNKARGAVGTPRLIEGRELNPESTDEIVLLRRAASRLNAKVGDRLTIAGCHRPSIEPDACAPGTPMWVVGIKADLEDASAKLTSSDPRIEPAPWVLQGTLEVSPMWLEAHPFAAMSFEMLLLRLRPESSVDDVHRELAAALPDWMMVVQPAGEGDIADRVGESIGFQGRGLGLTAVILAVAAALFIAQLVSRQTRADFADAPVMAQLGMDTGGLVTCAIYRAAPMALTAALAATATTLWSSAWGPTGLAGRIDPASGRRIDPAVLVVGSLATAAVVVAAVIIAAKARPRSAPPPSARRWSPPTATTLAASGMLRGQPSGSRRAAIAAVLIAVAATVSGAMLVQSYDRLVNDPRQFGVGFDFLIPKHPTESPGEFFDLVASDPLLDVVATIVSIGPAQLPGVPTTGLISVQTLKGNYQPPMLRGRLPTADGEVALGPTTMDELHTDIGHTIAFPVLQGVGHSVEAAVPLVVVGELLFHDGNDVVGPGRG